MCFFVKMNEENLKAPMVLYMRRVGAYGQDNAVLMRCFKDWLKANNRYCDDTVIWAVPLDNPAVTEARKCRYDVCVIKYEGMYTVTGSDEVRIRRLDGGRYVTFLIEHTAQAVQRAWAECFTELDKHNYLPDTSRPVMERYAKKLVDIHYCELCVPVL